MRDNPYCKRVCPYYKEQIRTRIEADSDNLPPKMCPMVAALAIKGLTENISSLQEIEEVELEPEIVEARRSLHERVDRHAAKYISKANRCARKLIQNGTNNVSLEDVMTVTDTEILSKINEGRSEL
jgi:hypothetical protein